MLWRANLFINESDFDLVGYDPNGLGSMNDNYDPIRDLTINREQLRDWNDLYPWASVENVWNYIYDGTSDYINNWSDRYTAGSSASSHTVDALTELPRGNGGQVVNILPSTWAHRHNNDINSNTDIDGSVIYYFGAVKSNCQHR